MANEKTLACIGLNGFDKARFRLLLAEAGERLRMQWTIGDPSRADVLIVAPDSLEGEAASLRARGRGVRCVNLGAPGEFGDDFLPGKFGVEDLVRVLNAASPPDDSQFHSIDADSPEFFGEVGAGANDAEADGIPEAVDLERYLSRDSGEYTLDKVVPYSLAPGTLVEPVDRKHVSHRAEARSSQREPFSRSSSTDPHGVINNSAGGYGLRTQGGLEYAALGRPFADYLEGSILMAPSQIMLEGAEPLVLDPKNKLYMITGDLEAAEPYVKAEFPPSVFQRLTTRELERWRALCEPRPYIRLRWLAALRGGDGWLPRHLDPGGSYRIRDMLELDEHFDDQIRIGETLLAWKRLHEVAAQAAVDMQAVFNTVAAYEAIGWLEWRPRERLR